MAPVHRRRRYLLRLRRQERPVPLVRLATGRDGRPHAGLGARALGDDGRGGRLSRGPLLSGAHARRASRDRLCGSNHALHRGHDRAGRQRHQAGACVLHRQPTRLHDARPWRGRLGGRTVSPRDPRVLQEPPLPLLRLGDPRLPHQRHAEDGWAGQGDALHGGHDARGLSGDHRRGDPVCDRAVGLLLQRLDPRSGTVLRAGQPTACDPLLCGGRRCRPDGLLHVPAVVHDVRR